MQDLLVQYYDWIRIITNIPNEIIFFIYYVLDRRVGLIVLFTRCLFIPCVGFIKYLWMVPMDPLIKKSASVFSFPSTHTVSISIPYLGLAFSIRRFSMLLYALYPILIISICASYEFFHFHSRYDVIAASGVSIMAAVFMYILYNITKQNERNGHLISLSIVLLIYVALLVVADHKMLKEYHLYLFTSIIVMVSLFKSAGILEDKNNKNLLGRLVTFGITILIFSIFKKYAYINLNCNTMLGDILNDILRGVLISFLTFVLPDKIVGLIIKLPLPHFMKLSNT